MVAPQWWQTLLKSVKPFLLTLNLMKESPPSPGTGSLGHPSLPARRSRASAPSPMGGGGGGSGWP
eukprot:262442-Pyramimonas_sp.AAC.1